MALKILLLLLSLCGSNFAYTISSEDLKCTKVNQWQYIFYRPADNKLTVEFNNLDSVYKVLNCPRTVVNQQQTIAYLVVIMATSLTIVVCYFFKRIILTCLYTCRIFRPLIPGREYNETKRYDAFVLYESKNSEITKEYVDKLEKGRPKFRLRYVDNDLSQETILKFMMDSKEIIVLMNREYLLSTVCRKNFYLALQGTSMDKDKQMIIVLYPDVGNIQLWGKELQSFINLSTCIKRDEIGFWSKLRYALPHRTKQDDEALQEKLLIESRYPGPYRIY